MAATRTKRGVKKTARHSKTAILKPNQNSPLTKHSAVLEVSDEQILEAALSNLSVRVLDTSNALNKQLAELLEKAIKQEIATNRRFGVRLMNVVMKLLDDTWQKSVSGHMTLENLLLQKLSN